MGINITHTMNNSQFENRETLRNTAKEILNKNNASKESIQKIVDKTIFNSDSERYYNPQLSIIKASSQISISNSLKETLRYLNSHAASKTQKSPILGEIWDLFNKTSDKEYNNELCDFVIDESAKNIFAAA